MTHCTVILSSNLLHFLFFIPSRRRPSVVGGNAAEPENFSDEGRDLDIDYPIEVEGSDASDALAARSTASTVSNSHPTGDRDNQGEVATPTFFRREEHRPEGTSNEDLDVTASTVPCSELDHPSSWSACGGVFYSSTSSQNGSITSQSGDQSAVVPHLNSVQEAEELFVESSQSDASDATTVLEPHKPHTDDANSLSHVPHVQPSLAPIGKKKSTSLVPRSCTFIRRPHGFRTPK